MAADSKELDPDLVITSPKWYLEREGLGLNPSQVRHMFEVLVSFLEENDLVASPLRSAGAPVNMGLEIRVRDLTAEGVALMRTGYQNWLTSLERKWNPENVRALNNGLQKLRKGE